MTSNNAESERRQATVMFADISGFTSMSEKMDPEDVTAVMNDCFEMLGSVIKEHDGHIDKFIGDCVMAVFGVPKAVEDAPAKAVACALEIRDRLYRFTSEQNLAIPLDIHIGVNTGMVIAGNVGSRDKKEYTVMGDTVNLASRLEEISEKGQIIVGSETWRYTQSKFEYSEPTAASIKGKSESVQIYKVLGETRRPPGVGGNAAEECTISSELVGRDRELNRLELALLEVINGRGGIINVIGEAGIGKSRLIADFIGKCSDRGGVHVLEGKALSMGVNLSFHPVIHLLKNWFDIAEDDDPAEALHKIGHGVKQIVGDRAGEIVPFLATIMGLELPDTMAEKIAGIDGDKLARLIALGMKDLLAAGASKEPIVVILEDAHWADISSIDLLSACLRLVTETPVLFINVYRPNPSQQVERLLDFINENLPEFASEIRLQPLDGSQAEKLIENLLRIESLPAKIKSEIIERTGGNPFFIEEVVRSLTDSGKIRIRNGACELLDDLDSVSIPGTVEEVIMTRVDRLEEEKREVLKVASVIGRYFFQSILKNVISDIDNLELHLEHLKGTQIIRERRRFEEVEYIFKHALAQEVIYNSILLKKKKLLHVSVARAIEVLFEDRLAEFYGMLAYHYSLGEDLENAEQYLQKAGEQALRSSASAEALNYFTTALKLYKKSFGDKADPKKIAELEQRIGTAYRNKGYYAQAVQHFQIAAGVLKYHIDPKNNFRFFLLFFKAILAILKFLRKKHPIEDRGLSNREKKELSLGFPLMVANSMVAVRDSLVVGYALLPCIVKNRERNEFCNLLICMAPMSLAFQGIAPGIARKLQLIAPLYISPDDKNLQFRYDFANIAFSLATGDTAPSYNEELLSYNLQYGDFQAVNCYLLWHGLLEIERGNFAMVEKIVSFSNGIVSDYENDEAGLHSAMLKGRYFVKIGDIDSAIDELGEAVRLGGLTGLAMLQGWSLGIKLQAEAMKKDWGNADKTMRQLLEYRDREPRVYTFTRSAQSIGELSYYLAKICDSNTLGESALTGNNKSIRQAIRTAAKNGSKWVVDRTEIYKIIGQIYFSMGKQKQAETWWEKTVESGMNLGAELEVAKAKAELEKLA